MAKTELSKGTEDKIIKVAMELFAKNGFEGTSIRDICKNAGVNISLISYYFGGKKELYEKIVSGIVDNIINYMKNSMGVEELPVEFEGFSREQKFGFLFKAISFMVDYFYSDNISDSAIMIFYREQITAGVPLNAVGYTIFRKLMASLLGKDENDKEVVFRCITIVGQLHSARVFKQFSMKALGQDSYTKEDTEFFKKIVQSQIKTILEGILPDEK